MASADSRVQFCYVPTGKSVPVTRDANTIYFAVDEKQIYVGADLISKDYAAEIQALVNEQITIVITGSGNVVSDASFDSTTHTLTLTKSSLPSAAVYTMSEKSTPTAGSIATYELLKDNVAEGDAIEILGYTITKASTAETGYAATYQLFQGSTAVGDKINIPKDMVVESAEIKVVTTPDVPYPGAQVGDKYIDFIIANKAQNHIYLPVNDLVDVYTAAPGATQVQLAISNTNEISATLVAGGVAATHLADGAVTANKVSIAAHTESQSAGADGLALSVTTTNGQVSAVSGSIAANTYDPYGAAAAAMATWSVIS